MRIFIALNFDKTAKAEMLAVQAQLRQAAAKGKFTTPDNLHLTLVFLGEISQKQIEAVKTAISKTVASDRQIDGEASSKAINPDRQIDGEASSRTVTASNQQAALTLQFDRSGRFSKARSGDIWWIGLKNNNKLNRLQRRLNRELIAAGFDLEKGRFTPHLTLARQVSLKPDYAAEDYKLDFQPFLTNVGKVSLMSSDRINDALTYTEIWSAPIK